MDPLKVVRIYQTQEGNAPYEKWLNFGPGYRVYFGQQGRTVVVLLCGRDKSTQTKDVKKAQEYWTDYRRRIHETL